MMRVLDPESGQHFERRLQYLGMAGPQRGGPPPARHIEVHIAVHVLDGIVDPPGRHERVGLVIHSRVEDSALSVQDGAAKGVHDQGVGQVDLGWPLSS